jgi:hypothetical protein
LTAFLEKGRIEMDSSALFAGQTVGQAVRPDIYLKQKPQLFQAVVRKRECVETSNGNKERENHSSDRHYSAARAGALHGDG